MGESLTGHAGTNKTKLRRTPRYCMVERAGFMCQTCYTKSMIIFDHFCDNLIPTKCW